MIARCAGAINCNDLMHTLRRLAALLCIHIFSAISIRRSSKEPSIIVQSDNASSICLKLSEAGRAGADERRGSHAARWAGAAHCAIPPTALGDRTNHVMWASLPLSTWRTCFADVIAKSNYKTDAAAPESLTAAISC
ncbi:hypothetical protein EVAR_47276_1 [Eumeta japonica]|uniref:Uncharacterized protein n=1 Tax=Eumeta variegata TaxID=151549 RepID=A0A4C1XEP1_EUMVA|nr:hypothetical protein EVAR_47276_1 [Eumeta japonica]